VIHQSSDVLVRAVSRPVVVDLSLARPLDATATRLTRTGTILGTPHSMSPEQVDGDVAAPGPATDVYSLGVIRFELLTGRVPFEGSLACVLGKILNAEPPLPSAHRSDIDPRLESICREAVSRSIADRHASMDELAAALEDYLASPGRV
jgi:serine/threonine protein kinase